MHEDERYAAMSGPQESWKDVADKVEALGLKLKMHLEQEADEEVAEPEPGDTRAAFENLGDQLQDAFDAFGNAAKDKAIHEDVKDIGNLLKDALVTTFTAVGAEVDKAMKKAEAAGEQAGERVAQAMGASGAQDTVVDTSATEAVAGADEEE